jgi:hypothetical protein
LERLQQQQKKEEKKKGRGRGDEERTNTGMVPHVEVRRGMIMVFCAWGVGNASARM